MEKRRQGNFYRTKPHAYVKLGRRTKARYKRPTGRHNKSRQKWRSRPPMVEVGYKNQSNERNLVLGKMPVWVYNVRDIDKIGKDSIAIIAKIGKKNKLAVAKEMQKRKLAAANLNINKFLKLNEKTDKQENKTAEKK